MKIFVKRTVGLLFACSAATVAAVPLSEEPGRVMYQIYVESFQDGATWKDGNGDFSGLEKRIPYLKELGVGGVLLMPIFDGDGMGYIPKDYYRLRRDYGASDNEQIRQEAFKRFLDAAHAAGIKVFIDTPVNHIGKESTWWKNSENRVAGYEDFFIWHKEPPMSWTVPWTPNSTWRDVFTWSDQRQEYYYALFGWGMPDLNHRSAAVQRELNKFFAYWSKVGVDGFRIDAAKHLVEGFSNANPVEPDNLLVLKNYLKTVRAQYPSTSFLLEAWDSDENSEAYLPESGDVIFDFAYMQKLRDSVVNDHPYAVRNAVKRYELVQSRIRPGNRLVFAGNHDIPRIRTYFGDQRGRSEIALALTFLLPSTPLLYYGDELHMPGRYIRSPNGSTNEVCTPMAWDTSANAGFAEASVKLGNGWNKKLHADWRTVNVASEKTDNGSFLNFVKALTAARKRLPIDNATKLYVNNADPSDPVLTYAMVFKDGSCAAGALNFSNREQANRSVGLADFCEPTVGEKLVARNYTQGSGDRVNLQPHGFWFGYRRR